MPRGKGTDSQVAKATLGLREAIYDGALRPGERVHEVNVGERLGVSRTPLRIALSTLAHEGLVEQLEGGGFVVSSFTREEVFDGIELRGVLEGTAARLATERLGDGDELARLREASEAMEAAVAALPDEAALVRYVELNESFHAELARLAKSPSLSRALAGNAALPFASPSALLSSYAYLPGAREILLVAQFQHRGLLDALASGQGTRAEEIGREHARLARLNLELVLDHEDALSRLPGHALLARAA